MNAFANSSSIRARDETQFASQNGSLGSVSQDLFDSRVSYLKILALSLLREIASAEKLDEDQRNGSIDLQAEVRRFEAELIRSALIQTGGRQRRAARLLRTKVTTLNTKIKRYKIRISDEPAATPDPQILGVAE
jgi:DNA-binding NtrC family response regulator